MKQKGFTLIELLAVIVVLAVIVLIAVPIITNVIDKARLGALKDSAYGILDAGELYIANNLKDGIESNLTFTCNKNKCTSETKEINYKGDINEGTLILTTDSKTLVCVDNGKNYALKLASDKDVTTGEGTCGSYEEENGSFNIISDIDTLKKELDDLKELVDQTDATVDNITEGKKAVTTNGLITGTLKTSDEIFTKSGSVSSGSDTKVAIETIEKDGKFYLTGLLTNACFNNNATSVRLYVNDTIIWSGSISTTSQSSVQKVTASGNVKTGDIIYYASCCVNHLGNASLYYDYYVAGN